MVKVKICGIQTPEHALIAAEAGADFIGIVFVPYRRRHVSQAQGQSIVNYVRGQHSSRIKIVGLFADQSLDDVNGIATHCNLDMVQLCGRESLSYCSRMSIPVIKVVHIPGGPQNHETINNLTENLKSLRDQNHLVTLDRKVKSLDGGTGLSFDWDIAKELSLNGHSFFLAGGLRLDNVTLAIKIAKPLGVDVSSGVETGGVKDPEKIKRFIYEAKGQRSQT